MTKTAPEIAILTDSELIALVLQWEGQLNPTIQKLPETLLYNIQNAQFRLAPDQNF